jgi:hypothetical protein
LAGIFNDSATARAYFFSPTRSITKVVSTSNEEKLPIFTTSKFLERSKSVNFSAIPE